LTSIKAPYEEIHHQLGPFDLYNDVFFAFSPGLGFPHQGPEPAAPVEVEAEATAEASSDASSTETAEIEPTPRNNKTLVQAQTTWHHPLRLILQTKCPLFFTAFSPLDLERDVSALQSTQPPTPPSVREFPEYVNLPTNPIDRIEGVSDEFELVLAPGRNMFGSEKWEIAGLESRRIGEYGVLGERNMRSWMEKRGSSRYYLTYHRHL
jgi:splicing suppressor protein 51